MPAEEALTPLGRRWRDELPVVLRDSPDHLAVVHSVAREVERLEAAIEQVRAQFFPETADLLLGVYEAELGTTVAPAGATLEERRQTVAALLRRQSGEPSGLDWQAKVTLLVGAGWTYGEHDPDDPTSAPDYTVRVRLPFPPSSSRYALTERLLRDITPAHIDLAVSYIGGFVLDESQLDQEAFG